MSRRKENRPLVFHDNEIEGLRQDFPQKTPDIENDLEGCVKFLGAFSYFIFRLRAESFG